MGEYSKLRGKIIEKCGSVKNFSSLIGKTPNTICAKLKGKSSWKDKDIDAACHILDISKQEAHLYFLP